MFDRDLWIEIYETIRANKLRTFLTAFSVAWGVFMLILLLGSGQGLQNGVSRDFKDDATNSIWITPGQMSVPYKGMKPGRRITMRNQDLEFIKNEVNQVEHITARHSKWSLLVTTNDNGGTFSFRGVHPDHIYLENSIITSGRFINSKDLDDKRKVAVIGVNVAQELFPDKDPINAYFNINGIPFKVVGTFVDEGSRMEASMIYAPITTAQQVFNGGDRIDRLMFTIGDASLAESRAIVKQTREAFSNKLGFAENDTRAFYVNNNVEEYNRIQSVFSGIEVFIWIIGFMTIIAGVVGVSNIMLIIVKERTKEIGIRKAIGATPASIVSLIVLESVIITSIAGYFGLVSGIFLLEFISVQSGGSNVFDNPGVELGVAFGALGILVVSGALAGIIPALKASRIKPIVALRND